MTRMTRMTRMTSMTSMTSMSSGRRAPIVCLIIICAGSIWFGSVVQLVHAAEGSRPRGQDICIVDEAAIADLKKAREELKLREEAVSSKESELKLREQRVLEQLGKLEQVREEFKKERSGAKAEDEEKVAKLVETYLAMGPKPASKLISALDENLAVTVLLQMDSVRLAKIMNVMDPARSTELSERIAGIKKVQPNNKNEKGGESQNGYSELTRKSDRDVSSTTADRTSTVKGAETAEGPSVAEPSRAQEKRSRSEPAGSKATKPAGA